MDDLHGLEIDAVPQRLPCFINKNTCNKFAIEEIVNDFSVEDYRSAFFLLMDYVKLENFFSLTKGDEPGLKRAFIDLYNKKLNDTLLVELLGTLKMYKRLRMLGTCCHIYESTEKAFNRIDGLWKILYLLCEELTDEDLEILKQQYVPSNFRDQILSTEHWFCWAAQKELFSRTDLSKLENIFQKYPMCLKILKSYKDFGLYEVRTPTASSHCGIALIINYDKFDERSGLKKRENSDKDVNSLIEVWEKFGFKTQVHSNLTSTETFEKMKCLASIDHSNYDVFVCCILSHGESNGVYSYDGKLMQVRDLQAPIVNDCLSLNKKPKLFFIQACQGTNIPQGVGKPIYQIRTNNTSVPESCNSSVPPMLSDVLTVYSSIDGFVSFRDYNGSWFIQPFCKLMLEYGDSCSVEDVMIKVSNKVGQNSVNLGPSGPTNALQIVGRLSTLQKKLILKKRIV